MSSGGEELVTTGAPAAGRNVRKWSCASVMSSRIGPRVHAFDFITAEQTEDRVSACILDFLEGVREKLGIH